MKNMNIFIEVQVKVNNKKGKASNYSKGYSKEVGQFYSVI